MNQLKQVNFALELHRIAAKREIANVITYAGTITAIVKSATLDENFEGLAFLLLDEAAQRFNRPDMKHGSPIDLHDLSYGEVYFGLKRRLNTEVKKMNSSGINLPIIYGRGQLPTSHWHEHLNDATAPNFRKVVASELN
jgi:hypothetical protein